MPAAANAPLILGLGGTSRNGSSSERVLRVALAKAEEIGARTAVIAGEDMVLPMYSPVSLERTERAARLVDLFRQADGLIIASPAYHGSISGLLKNAIDYTEDLRGDRRVYWDGCAVGCICCAAGWQAGAQTLTALRSVVHALRGWPTPFGAIVNTSLPIFDEKGALADESVRAQLELVGSQVAGFALMHAQPARSQAIG
jgi:FMN reductase